VADNFDFFLQFMDECQGFHLGLLEALSERVDFFGEAEEVHQGQDVVVRALHLFLLARFEHVPYELVQVGELGA